MAKINVHDGEAVGLELGLFDGIVEVGTIVGSTDGKSQNIFKRSDDLLEVRHDQLLIRSYKEQIKEGVL